MGQCVRVGSSVIKLVWKNVLYLYSDVLIFVSKAHFLCLMFSLHANCIKLSEFETYTICSKLIKSSL